MLLATWQPSWVSFHSKKYHLTPLMIQKNNPRTNFEPPVHAYHNLFFCNQNYVAPNILNVCIPLRTQSSNNTLKHHQVKDRCVCNDTRCRLWNQTNVAISHIKILSQIIKRNVLERRTKHKRKTHTFLSTEQ